MSKKFLPGDKIGPVNTLLKKRLENGRGIFECSFCGREFEAAIGNVSRGGTKSCGCATGKLVGASKTKNISGQKYGHLTALYNTGKKSAGHSVWHCRCDCGNEIDCTITNLRSGNTTTCGDVKNCEYAYRKSNGYKELDLTGQRFGNLVAISPIRKPYYKTKWVCQCDCGNRTEVSQASLLNGNTQSCGCIKSRGEQRIMSILSSLKIGYVSQATFDTCKSPKTGHVYYFDFYLPDYDTVIEYDGAQHFDESNEWNSPERMEADAYKTQWCADNGYKLIRISYEDFDKIDGIYLVDKIRQE